MSKQITLKQTSEAVKLRDAVTETRSVEIQVKPELWAYRCDCCGKLFTTADPSGSSDNCKMSGKFKGASISAQGYMNNNFYARICSFACADNLMNEGWKELEEFQPYVSAGATLVVADVKMTTILEEDDLIEIWEKN